MSHLEGPSVGPALWLDARSDVGRAAITAELRSRPHERMNREACEYFGSFGTENLPSRVGRLMKGR